MPSTTAQKYPDGQDSSYRATVLFNTLSKRAFRRELPTDEDQRKMLDILSDSISQDKPIPLLKYWAKTDSEEIGEAQLSGLRFLADNLKDVAAMHKPGIELTLLFVDTHVRFNGATVPDAYLEKLEGVLQEVFPRDSGVKVTLDRLSDHVRMPDGGVDEFDFLKDRASKTDITPDILERLAPRAKKYYFRTEDDAQAVAKMYYELCKEERAPVGKAFPNRIFLTYNPGDQRDFSVPEGLPSLSISSLKRGITEKPWNIAPEEWQGLQQRYHLKSLTESREQSGRTR